MIDSKNYTTLSIQDTNILKGIALLLLLWHHLFYAGDMPVNDITLGHYPLVLTTGICSKVCVAIFVFLSGYGLTITTNNKGGIVSLYQFYKNRLLKLMINYWFIYLLFVPLGYFAFDRTFENVYHGSRLRAILDLFGLHFAVTKDYFGYNPTWWFYGCIIVLYLLFPLLHKLKNYWYLLIPLSVVFQYLASEIIIIHSCSSYLLAFVLGITFAHKPLPKIERGHDGVLLLFIAFGLICWYRLHCTQTLLWDAVISLSLTILYQNIQLPNLVAKLFSFLGKHSFNIFLFHTFIYFFYFKEYIYWSENPILIYITLLVVSIIISLTLEWIKEFTRINKLQKKLTT